ncbi:MAG: DMT family transporter [Myxococcaceae bacterium]|nr:DMT family transporter [Myxococcaceae bacterium]
MADRTTALGGEAGAAAPLGAVYAALLAQTAISAGTYLAAKQAMVDLRPLELVMARFATSGIVFVLLLAVLPGPALPPKEARLRVFLLGVLAGPLNQGFFFFGLDHSTAAHAALLYALTPLGVYLYLVWRGEAVISRTRVLGIGVAFIGVVMLLLGRGLRAAIGPLWGDALILVAVAAWVLYTAEGRVLIERYGAFRATAWTMTVASFVSVPFAPLVVHLPHFTQASHLTWWMIVYLGLATSVISYILWYFALSRLEASKVAVFANLQPAATALAAWALLGEPLTWEIFAGGALVIAGVRITQRRTSPPALR